MEHIWIGPTITHKTYFKQSDILPHNVLKEIERIQADEEELVSMGPSDVIGANTSINMGVRLEIGEDAGDDTTEEGNAFEGHSHDGDVQM